MVDRSARLHAFERPYYLREPEPALPDRHFATRLSPWRRLTSVTAVRQVTLLVLLAAAWQLYGAWLGNDLVLPDFAKTAAAFWHGIIDGPLLLRAWTSIRVLFLGYAIAIVLAAAVSLLAVASRVGNDVLALFTAMFNPLPAIALLPLALLWFGLGEKSVIFVLVHAVLWPLALNTHTGFLGVSQTLRMTGKSFGLKGPRYALLLLVPAAFPSILTGLKIGWAFAWRTLIAAELVFGVSAGSGGLGWYIYENRNQLEIANVFAGLLAVILIGLAMESVVFRAIERITVRRWGMQT
ncbi:MAG TPA: ABC transporter permease subunit [Stellaceae bacterium]|nr:ABC transporter permease subunit [Stellaceae bacterium]